LSPGPGFFCPPVKMLLAPSDRFPFENPLRHFHSPGVCLTPPPPPLVVGSFQCPNLPLPDVGPLASFRPFFPQGSSPYGLVLRFARWSYHTNTLISFFWPPITSVFFFPFESTDVPFFPLPRTLRGELGRWFGFWWLLGRFPFLPPGGVSLWCIISFRFPPSRGLLIPFFAIRLLFVRPLDY